MQNEPRLAEIEAAAARLAGRIHRTPVMRSAGLDALTGAELTFKCESLQRTGSFKIRGAMNAVLSLSGAEAAPGVLTHSSGNFAAALALAARERGVAAHIVMPDSAPAVKQAAVRAYGGRVTFCAPTLTAREETAARIQAETGARFVHPYDDYAIIAGQGTAALELWREAPDLQAIVIPVGGGGLSAGCALATAALAPRAEILGAEPAGADDAYRSLLAGERLPQLDPRTCADGLRTALGERNFPILSRLLAGIVTVSEDEIVAAMRLVWERLKILVEPSGAVPLAAVLAAPARFRGRRVGLILSGGNVDLDALPWQAAAR
ncbi:pyridoxal-phosphate dependent enzyme [bacterium]|nr:pyridoxal-phosphate dependent enzyme [bacterium]